MDQQVKQTIQSMMTIMMLPLVFGMAKPMMFQQEAIPYSVALSNARRWAAEHAATSASASVALAYIDAVPEAKQRGTEYGISEAEAERTQLLYVLSNLASWRGPEARSSKVAIKKRIKDLGGTI